MNLKALSNLELHRQTKYQAGVVRAETTKLLHHLVEVERRRVYAEFGTISLFDYCVRHLEMSHPCASRHVNSARMMREMPEIEEKIHTGELTLTSVSQAQVFFKREEKLAEVRRGTDEVRRGTERLSSTGKKFSTEEKREVLSQIAKKSTREAEQVLLSLSSEPAAVSIERVRAITETTAEIKFAANKETMANLERLKEIWSHKMPGASFGELIKEMARVLVEQHDPLKKADRALARKEQRTKKPGELARVVSELSVAYEASAKVAIRSVVESEEQTELVRETVETAYETTSLSLGSSPAPDEATQQQQQQRSRYISSAVRHAVYTRDGGACTHVDPQTGERCSSRYRIDLDHIIAFAKGGESTVENLRLRCRQHNLWSAIRMFGWKKCRVAAR